MIEMHEVNVVFQPLNYWSVMLLRMLGVQPYTHKERTTKLHAGSSKFSPIVCVCVFFFFCFFFLWGLGGGGGVIGCVYLCHLPQVVILK